jgi:hypothetical protein
MGKGGYKGFYKWRDLTPQRFPFVLEQSGHKERVGRQLDRANFTGEVMCGGAKAVPK